jgi:hypothetical protein
MAAILKAPNLTDSFSRQSRACENDACIFLLSWSSVVMVAEGKGATKNGGIRIAAIVTQSPRDTSWVPLLGQTHGTKSSLWLRGQGVMD